MSSGPFTSSRQVTAIPRVDPRQWPPPPHPAACAPVSPWKRHCVCSQALLVRTSLCHLLSGCGSETSPSPTDPLGPWLPWRDRQHPPRPHACPVQLVAPPGMPPPPLPSRKVSGFGVWKGRAQPLPFPPRAPSPSSDCVSPCGTWRAQHFRRSCGVLPLLSFSCQEPGTQGLTHPGQGPEGSIVGQGTAAPGHLTASSPIHQPHACTPAPTCTPVPGCTVGSRGAWPKAVSPPLPPEASSRAVRLSLPPQTALPA